MQSSANVQLTPEEKTTVRVPSEDFRNLSERALRVVGMAGLPVGDCDEGIPFPPFQELYPGLF